MRRTSLALLCLAFATPIVSFANPELFEMLVLTNAVAFAVLREREPAPAPLRLPQYQHQANLVS